MNASLRFGFEYDRNYKLIDIIVTVQCVIPLFNVFFLHPVTLLTLYSTRKNMTAPILWGYVTTEIGLTIHDVGFYLLRIYFVMPFSGFYCEGIICRIGLQNTTLMTFLNFVIVANFPCFLSILVSMHQALIGNSSNWRLSRLKQSIISGFITGIFVINIIGFNFLARDCDDAPRLVKQPELQWLLGRNGNVFIFGDFGNPQYFRYEMYLFAACMPVVFVPTIFFFTHSLDTLRKMRKMSTMSDRTRSMTGRMFDILAVQMNGATVLVFCPLLLFVASLVVDWRWLFSDVAFTVVRVTGLTLFLLHPTHSCIVFIVKSIRLKKMVMFVQRALKLTRTEPITNYNSFTATQAQ